MHRYDELRKDYIADFRAAKDHAEAWWSALLETETQLLGDRASAEESLQKRWPFGPTGHPRVVGVYRKYARACQAITNDLEANKDEERDNDAITSVPTSVFLVDYICDESKELGTFLRQMVFVPLEQADQHVMPTDLE